MKTTSKDFIKRLVTLNEDQSSREDIHKNILSGMELKGSNFLILLCAIVIASVGLNVGSTAVVIGAMLISPIMGTIISMGYALAIYDTKILRRGLIYFTIQLLVALVASTLYFLISPVKVPSGELIARTSPTFFDLIIAFVGGIAGTIAITRKEKTNVIPGVAIATALMPPLCTVGFGIANGDGSFILGAGYLFLINTFYILLATLIVTTVLRLRRDEVKSEKFIKIRRRVLIGMFLIITIPSFISGYKVTKDVVLNSKIDSFVTSEVNDANHTVVSQSVSGNEITLAVVGKRYTKKEKSDLESTLPDYKLDSYTLTIIQDDSYIAQQLSNAEQR